MHDLCHLPSRPDRCETCAADLQHKTPAKRVLQEQKQLASMPGGKVHLDLIGPVGLSWDDSNYLFVSRDEARNYRRVMPIRGKSIKIITHTHLVPFVFC